MTVNKIDHTAISEKHRSHFLDLRALRAADVGLTDLRTQLKIKMSKVSNLQPSRLYDTKKLKDNRVRESFRDGVGREMPRVRWKYS